VTGIENLIKKIYEIHRASLGNLMLPSAENTVASMMEIVLRTRYMVDLTGLLGSLTDIMQVIGGLRITRLFSGLPSIELPDLQIPVEEDVAPEPPSFRISVTQRLTSITDGIMGFIRGLGPGEEQESLPPALPVTSRLGPTGPRAEVEYTVPDYIEHISTPLAAATPFTARQVKVAVPPPTETAPLVPPTPTPTRGAQVALEALQEAVRAPPEESYIVQPPMLPPASQLLSPVVSPAIPDATPVMMQIKAVASIQERLARVVAGVRRASPAAMETRLVDTVMEVRSRAVDPVSRRVLETITAGGSIPWKPSILEAVGSRPRVTTRADASAGLRIELPSGIPVRMEIQTPTTVVAPTLISEAVATPETEPSAMNELVAAVQTASTVSRELAERVTEAYTEEVIRGLPLEERMAAERMASPPLLRVTDVQSQMMASQAGVSALRRASQAVQEPEDRLIPPIFRALPAMISTLTGSLTSASVPRAVHEQLGLVTSATQSSKEVGLVPQLMAAKSKAEDEAAGAVASLAVNLASQVSTTSPIQAAAPGGVVASPKLQDIVAKAALTKQVVEATKAAKSEETKIVRSKPIEIKVETPIEEVDLRELERKITRILKEEARRYGVYR